MCKEQAIAFLTSKKLQDEVEREVDAARSRGVTGVPYVVVNDRYGICGGFPAETYVEVRQLFDN
jgi:predicted DsbA family dithiol-disulfide isomerase